MNSLFRNRVSFYKSEAFSLVEVAIAIGIISFSLIALVALLPVGMGAVEASREQSSATSALDQISTCVEEATTSGTGFYTASGAYSNITWSSGAPTTIYLNNISMGGVPSSDSADQRLSANIQIIPATSSSVGTVFISIAWPASATWSQSTLSWHHAQGSVSRWVTFFQNQ